MNLSVELYTIAEKFGDLKAIEIVSEAGFDAIDYSYYYNKECEEVLGDNYIEYARKLKLHLDKCGIICNQAHAPVSLQYGMDEATFEQKYRLIVRALESASILGAKHIVVHSVTVPAGVDFEQYNIDYYKSFIPYCEKFNICIAVENLFTIDTKRNRLASKLGTPEELNRIIEKINSRWIVACIDIGHASLTGYEPEDFIKDINPSVLRALHVHDNDYLDDRHVLPYTGSLNWDGIMAALRSTGYTGDLTFEIIKFLDKIPEELVLDALKFSVAIGKYLVSIYNR